MATNDLNDLHWAIAEFLDEIKRRFTRDFHGLIKGTLILRVPGDPEMDVVVTEDTSAGIREVLDRSDKREEKKLKL